MDLLVWDSWWNEFGFDDLAFRIQCHWPPLRNSVLSSPVNPTAVSFPPGSLAFHLAGSYPSQRSLPQRGLAQPACFMKSSLLFALVMSCLFLSSSCHSLITLCIICLIFLYSH